jgi:hypothetical protein
LHDGDINLGVQGVFLRAQLSDFAVRV